MARRLLLPTLALALWSLWAWPGMRHPEVVADTSLSAVESGQATAGWLRALGAGAPDAWTRARVGRAWRDGGEVAPLARWLHALGAPTTREGRTDPFGPAAPVTLALALLTLALLFHLVAGTAGRAAAWTSLGLCALSPGAAVLWGAPGPEAVASCAWTLLAASLGLGLRRPAWRVVSLPAFGLVLAASGQGPWLWLAALGGSAWALREAPESRCPGLVQGWIVPWNVALLPLAGAATLVALWPPLWMESAKPWLDRLWLAPWRAPLPALVFRGRLFDPALDRAPPAMAALEGTLEPWPLALLAGALLGVWWLARRSAKGSGDPGRGLLLPATFVLAALALAGLRGWARPEGLRLDALLLPLVAALSGPGWIALGRALAARARGRLAGPLRAGLPLLAVLSVGVERANVHPYEDAYRSPVARRAWAGRGGGSTREPRALVRRAWLTDLASARPEGASLALLPREADHRRLLDRLATTTWFPDGIRPAALPRADCVGLVHLPEVQDPNAEGLAAKGRREIARVVLDETPLLRLWCRDASPALPPDAQVPGAVPEEGSKREGLP